MTCCSGGASARFGFLFTGKLPAFIVEHGAFAMEVRQELLWVESDPRREILTGLRSVVSSYVARDDAFDKGTMGGQ